MQYQVTITFEDNAVSKEKIDYFLASLNYRKTLWHSAESFPVEKATVAVVDEEPDFFEEEFTSGM